MKKISLSQKAMSAVRWTTINTISKLGLQILSLIILGRLLDPVAFGLMGMIMIVIEIVNIFAGMGLNEAIIHKNTVSRKELSSLYFLNVTIGFMIFILMFMLSDYIGCIYSEKAVVPLVKIMSSLVFISSFGMIFEILLRKHLMFASLAKVAILSQVISFFSMIVLATQGFGVYALVFGQVVLHVVKVFLLLMVGFKKKWMPQFRFCFQETKFYLKFGAYQVLAMTVNQFNSRVDQLLIGGMLGPTVLGYYNVAFRIIYMPIESINPILSQVALPLFSIIQNDTERLKQSYLKYINLIISINLPVLAGLTSIAHILIPFFLSDKWIPAIPIVQALSFYVFIRSIFNANGSLINAKGKVKWAFYWSLVMLLVIPATAYIVLITTTSVVMLCLCLGGIFFGFFFLNYFIFLKRLLGSFFLEYILIVIKPLLISVSMAALIYLLSMQIQHWKTAISVLVLIVFGVLYYAVLSIVFNSDFVNELEKILPEKIGSKFAILKKYCKCF